jgi:hypothetical protein
MEMSTLLETVRGYQKTGDLGVALVILAIGVIVTALYILLPIIFGGYFRKLEKEKSSGGGKQFWGFLVGLIYLFIGTIFLIAMFIPLAYFMLWEAGGTFWRVSGSLVLLLAITVSILMHGFIRKRQLAKITPSASGKTADGR